MNNMKGNVENCTATLVTHVNIMGNTNILAFFNSAEERKGSFFEFNCSDSFIYSSSILHGRVGAILRSLNSGRLHAG